MLYVIEKRHNIEAILKVFQIKLVHKHPSVVKTEKWEKISKYKPHLRPGLVGKWAWCLMSSCCQSPGVIIMSSLLTPRHHGVNTTDNTLARSLLRLRPSRGSSLLRPHSSVLTLILTLLEPGAVFKGFTFHNCNESNTSTLKYDHARMTFLLTQGPLIYSLNTLKHSINRICSVSCNFLRLDKLADVHWHVGHVSTPQAAHLGPEIAPTLADNTIWFHEPEPGPH